MTTETLPLERFYDLGRLSEAGDEIVLAPTGADLTRLAQWVDVVSIEAFTATVALRRKSVGNFHLEAKIEADITQSCVVTLDPVKAHVSTAFSRELHLSKAIRRPPPGSEVLSPGAGDDDVPEELDSPHYDLAGPVLEEFSLAIDPYPRSPGAAFESAVEAEDVSDNPFAVLKSLKTGV